MLVNPLAYRNATLRDDRETCGIMVGQRLSAKCFRVSRFVNLKNHAKDPTDNFVISASTVERMMAGKYSRYHLIGPWHSHICINPEHDPRKDTVSWPSQEDYKGLPKGAVGCILSKVNQQVTWYTEAGMRCFQLTIDW